VAEFDHLTSLDRELVNASRGIKVLSELVWEPKLQESFIANWQSGKPVLPDVHYSKADHTDQIRQLESIAKRAAALDHPLGNFLTDTARSYIDVARMIENIDSPQMSDLSIGIYGRPGDPLTGGNGTTSLDAAKYFLTVGNEFYRSSALRDTDYCVTAQAVRDELESGLTAVFKNGEVSVVIDPKLVSKAAAGATRIRLRDATCFSSYDVQQLLQHEAFVHSLTALNGRRQPVMSSMSLGAPRTTAAQEGLATFSELLTGAIDISRLERIALRIVATDMALGGADFIDVFRYFVETDQPLNESYNSTMRIFRGAPLTGGHAFTKDAVYLRGMLEVHTFFRWAFKEQKLGLCEHFFAGRMTLGDVVRYEEFFQDGTLRAPTYLPPWMTRANGLGGYLAFSVFANAIDLSVLHSAHQFDDAATSV
jgi:uncharacterized protein (TIGR02421 family)